jgi:hypothetical protein
MQFISTKQPLGGGRIGQAADLDSAAAYFLSDESRFVTGQVLAADGGWSVSDGQVPVEAPAQKQAPPKNLIRTLAGIWARFNKS